MCATGASDPPIIRSEQRVSQNGLSQMLFGCWHVPIEVSATNHFAEPTRPTGTSQEYRVRESMNRLAASAASLDYVKFLDVIRSAVNAASRKPKSREPRPRGAWQRRASYEPTYSHLASPNN